MIILDDIQLQRGGKPLLDHTSAQINPGEHVAVVGANGSGKSSLFQLLCGELPLEEGSLQLPDDWRIAQMRQEVTATQRPALDYVMDGHSRFRELEAELADCRDDHRLAELHGELDNIRAYEIPSCAERLLAGLGFAPEQVSSPVASFSGGWRIRLNLAQALMTPSDLLLLDEPTNHLDLDASLWLEQWLQAYPGTLLLISHDREFIDAACDHVLHIEHRQIQRYRGNYSAFEEQRSERLAQQQQAYEKQQAEIAHMEDFIRRFRAKATKARQAQSRIKALERMTRIAPAHVDSPFSFAFPEPRRFSDPLLNLSSATLGYESPVLREVKLSIHPGSRVGLLGANGAGKSTLLKTLAGELPLLDGRLESGEHLQRGYFSQHQLEALDLDASPLTQLQRARPDVREQQILDFLGGFDFRGEMATGGCRHFSGGEKARLALALVVWQRPNLLLLDEPTNHLDLDMCHALAVALQDFEGAVVLVSHDRHLLRNTVDEFLLVHDGRVDGYKGDLDDYRRWLLGRSSIENSEQGSGKSAPSDRKQGRRRAAEARARLSPLKKEIRRLEGAIETAQAKLSTMERQLADADLYSDDNADRLQTLLREQAELKKRCAEDEERWLALQEELEALS